MNLNLIAVAAAFDEADEKIFGLRRGAEVHLRRQHAENRPGPRVTPLPVCDHLAFVDNGRVIARPEVQLLCRGGDMGIPFAPVLLLAGGQAAINARVQQRLLRFQRQQAERREIHAGRHAFEPLEARIGLSRIRAAEVQDKVPLHGTRLRVLILRVQRQQQLQAGTDRLRHIPNRPDRAQPVAQQQLGREALRVQQTLRLRLRLRVGEIPQRLLRRRAEHIGIALQNVLRQPGRRVFRQIEPRAQKAAENFRQPFAVAALLQRKELVEPAGGLRFPNATDPAPAAQPVQYGAVVALRQLPRGAGIPLRAVPAAGEQFRRPRVDFFQRLQR